MAAFAKNRVARSLQTVLFVTSVVVPLLVTLIWTGLLFAPLDWPNWLIEVMRWVLWFYFIPVFAVYSGLAFLRFMPRQTSQLLQLSWPLLVSLGSFLIWRHDLSNIPRLLYAEAAPYILGFALIMMGGVVVLAFRTTKAISKSKKDDALRLFVLLLLAAPWCFSLYVIFLTGLQAWRALSPSQAPWLTTLLFITNIGLVCFVYLAKLKQLYQEGRL